MQHFLSARSWATWACAMTLSMAAQANVISTLPVAHTPGGHWTEIEFSGTSMVTSSTSVVMTTANYRGVWFGNGSNYGDTPDWSLGSNAQGNALSFTASFSSNAVDWSVYLLDGSHEAAIIFRPSGCVLNNCYSANYSANAFAGIEVYYRNAQNVNVFERFFVDVTQAHTYSFLLKDDKVLYELDGQRLYAGKAMQVPFGGSLLVIGDGSGSTGTGVGSMTISGLAANNAPIANVPTSAVPEPQTWAMAMAGLLLVFKKSKSKRFRAS